MADATCSIQGSPCYCLLSDVFDLLGRRYAMEVVCIIAVHGTARFGTIESHLPSASTSTLSTRLSELVDAGFLSRIRYDEIPPRIEYELTADGEMLAARLQPLLSWVASR